MHRTLSLMIIGLLALSVFSMVVGQANNAEALSAVTFNSLGTLTSTSTTQFQRVYENGTNSIISLDANSNNTIARWKYTLATNTTSAASSSIIQASNSLATPSSYSASSTDNTNSLQTWMNQATQNQVTSTCNSGCSGSITAEAIANTNSALYQKYVNKVTLVLAKTGSPTGTATIGIWNSAGVLQFTFGTIDVSTLTTSPVQYTFTNVASTSYLTANGDRIGLQYTGGSGSAWVGVYDSSTNTFDGTNSVTSTWTGASWSNINTSDMAGLILLTYNVNDLKDGSTVTAWRNNVNSEAGAYVCADQGATQFTTGVRLYFGNSTQIPQTIQVKYSTSSCTASLTNGDLWTPTVTTGYQDYTFSSGVAARYIRLEVNTWGSAVRFQTSEFFTYKATAVNTTPYVSSIETTNQAFVTGRDTLGGKNLGAIINLNTMALSSVTELTSSLTPKAIIESKTKVYTALIDGSNNLSIGIANRDFTGYSEVSIGDTINAGGSVKMVVYEGSPDTVYLVYSKTATTLKVAKYTSSASVISGTLAQSSDAGFSVVQLSGKFLVQTNSRMYEFATSTDTATQADPNTFLTYYPQTFSLNSSARTLNTTPIIFSNSTFYGQYVPSTGTRTNSVTAIVSGVNPGTSSLTIYAPAKYFYLYGNMFTLDAASAGATSWTLKKPVNYNQYTVSPYSERLNVPLSSNSTLLGLNVARLVCDASYQINNAALGNFIVGSDSDCTKWVVLPDSSSTIGRQIFIPFTRSPDLVHTSPMTAYTFTINSGTPTYYYIKSSYGGKVVDAATFDSSGQAQQHYLFGNCYTVQVTNTNSGQSALAGNICAGEDTTKPIDVNAVQVPVNWQGSAWATNSYRNYTDTSSNTVIFTVDKNEHPWNATIHVVDNQLSTPTYDQWFNYTNQNAAQTITINGINGNQTLYFDGYENGVAVFNVVVAGQGFNLNGLGFTNLGSIFGVPIAGMFVIIIGGIFTRSSATFGFIAVLAVIGLMTIFGLLNINPAFWAAMMGMSAVGIFAYKRLS